LFEDAEFVRLIEGTEMDGRWVYRGGDVHQLQTKGATGKRKIANVTDERDVGVVYGDGEVGLVGKTGGVIHLCFACRFLFLLIAGVIRAGSCVDGCGSRQDCGGSSRTPKKFAISRLRSVHHFIRS
jgi:hypothetical protein